jgi:hypothetical protein
VDLGFGGFWSMLNQNFKGYRNETQALVDFWSETLTSWDFGGGSLLFSESVLNPIIQGVELVDPSKMSR